MRDRWYRDPRTGLAAAVAAAVVVGIVAGSDDRPAWYTLMLALSGFALVTWGWFAVQGIGWLWRQPDKADVLRALTMQRSQHAFNHAAWSRFDRDAAMLRMLLAERALIPVEAELVRHASAVERFDAVAATLPDFSQAAARWYDIASQGHGGLPPATPAPTQAALDEAEQQLPATPLSEDDRRAALHYLVVRKRLLADRTAVERERTAALRKLATPPPSPPVD